MSNIIESATSKTYLGMHTIQLSNNWSESGKNPIVGPNTYLTYLAMRDWLAETNTEHKFHWINTGAYLPDSVSIRGDSAVIFMLRYGIGN